MSNILTKVRLGELNSALVRYPPETWREATCFLPIDSVLPKNTYPRLRIVQEHQSLQI